jgi:hypothetical protein
MKISPRFTADDWKALDFTTAAAWPRALDIFQDRIEGRFLTPLRMIRCYPWSGFAMLALAALLVETLQQFCEGEPITPDGKDNAYFTRLLCGPLFPARDQGFNRTAARLFYIHIRCGLLHQAQVTGTSRVWRDAPLVEIHCDATSGPGTKRRPATGITVNPLKFHDAVEDAFRRYVSLLNDPDPAQDDRRAKFRRKMDGIAAGQTDDVQD